MKRFLTLLLVVFLTINTQAQTQVVSRVNLKSKQNQMASEIPKILVDAFSRGDIEAYYPKNVKTPVTFAQFLHHFGMNEQAFRALMNTSPGWKCGEVKPILVDPYVQKCFQYDMEIVERIQRNNVTYEQERKLDYLRLIYSNQCTQDGVEVQGPIFKITDIADLYQQRYGVVNVQNSAVKYSVLELLRLKLYSPN